MLSREGWLVKVHLKVRGDLVENLLFDHLIILFELYWEQVTDLLHVDFHQFSLYLKEPFKMLFSIFNFLLIPNQAHLSEVVWKIIERVAQFFPITRHFLDSDFAWIDLHFYLFNMIHDNLAITHL